MDDLDTNPNGRGTRFWLLVLAAAIVIVTALFLYVSNWAFSGERLSGAGAPLAQGHSAGN